MRRSPTTIFLSMIFRILFILYKGGKLSIMTFSRPMASFSQHPFALKIFLPPVDWTVCICCSSSKWSSSLLQMHQEGPVWDAWIIQWLCSVSNYSLLRLSPSGEEWTEGGGGAQGPLKVNVSEFTLRFRLKLKLLHKMPIEHMGWPPFYYLHKWEGWQVNGHELATCKRLPAGGSSKGQFQSVGSAGAIGVYPSALQTRTSP